MARFRLLRYWIGWLLGLAAAAGPGCTSTPPEGTPIDLEAMREFKPFELRTLGGETRRLDDYLDRVTLVAFFFPT
jgi:hypothetical protein